jgi:hypothetical protein
VLRPGFGESTQDEAVLWIDADHARLHRVHITLEGYPTTRGAHVDTTFLEYHRIGPYLLPARFFERMRGPLRIAAHEWHVTALDLDRGWTRADVIDPGGGFRGQSGRIGAIGPRLSAAGAPAARTGTPARTARRPRAAWRPRPQSRRLRQRP